MPLDREACTLTSPEQALNATMAEFIQQHREEGRLKLEQFFQSRIDELESTFKSPKQKRSKTYYTPLGKIVLTRRAYKHKGRYTCIVDQMLGLPKDGWFTDSEELLSALGVTTEFPHACRLFARFTGIEMSDHGLANRVEASGKRFHEQLKEAPAGDVYPLDSALHLTVCRNKSYRPVMYVGVDGIMTPLRGAYREAKAGVVFWEYSHIAISKKRREIRRKDYVATLESRELFNELMYKRFAAMAQEHPCQVVVLGDGAKWIWEMAEEYYPGAIQILDFYHVSSYVWKVGRELYPEDESQQKNWVETQLKRLKASSAEDVIEGLRFLKGSKALSEAIQELKRYLENNAERIDYRKYREMGLMIGSGVVESSNRRVVTQRLKQAGMHWSDYGANAVMALRACYLSSSDQWLQFWKQDTA